MISTEELRRLKKRYRALYDEADQEWFELYKDISDYLLPKHGRFSDRDTTGGRNDNDKGSKIVNSAASRAMGIAVSGIKGGLVPHSLPWFRLSLWDEDMADWRPAKEWLHKVQQIMYGTFSRSNFYSAVHTPFLEQLAYGTGPLSVYEDKKTGIHCVPWTAGSYVLATDGMGRVDTGMRWQYMSVRALAERFGEKNISTTSKSMLQSNPDKMVIVVNAVFPRKDHDPKSKASSEMPWASIYWEKHGDEDAVLSESGFSSQPCMFPRWEVVGEDAYGSNCPGIEMLRDIKMLQKMERDKLAAIDKVVNPPMRAPASLKGRLSLLPNKVNYVDGQLGEQIQPIVQVQPQIQYIAGEIREVENRIKEGFFNDLFLMILDDKSMTATEVARRHEEKLAILGPVIERQNSEFLSPFIDRTFDILMRSGVLPPAPKEMQGLELKVEYISLLAQAQKAVGVAGIEKQVQFVSSLAQLYPDALDTLNPDEIADEYGELQGLNPKIMRSREEREQIRGQRAAAQQQAQQMEQMQQASVAAKNLGSTPMGEDGTALDSIMQRLPAV